MSLNGMTPPTVTYIVCAEQGVDVGQGAAGHRVRGAAGDPAGAANPHRRA